MYNGHHIQYHLYTVVCLSLPLPTNGGVSYSDMTLGENTVATYTCNTSYTLTGGTTRTCTCERIGGDTTRVCVGGGNWSGSPPTCQGELCSSSTVCVTDCEVNVVMLRITHTRTTQRAQDPLILHPLILHPLILHPLIIHSLNHHPLNHPPPVLTSLYQPME